ncbi:DUF1330 domain-containing protein [Pollutimonas harenae]|uniref:DUF1330 domain-containing protein n=1 Tax=Pollutimonas harenae TaxID=657015 RepID=A0A853H3H9_9BURK|nr:DUF1330 domain-containing protein [Pollutimonas harenae]NYT84694.1 DUF1330 domain-containing protein [Pollutimonas harenae]TEA72903.1 DUF1330 domain-containing protein [Pollutimonas harenae]
MSGQKGYIYAELAVNDSSYFFSEYMPRVKPVLEQYDAKFLVAQDDPEVIEGGRKVKRIVFIEFDSPEKAREFYYSKDYQDIIQYRFDSASAHLYLLDGVAP